MAKKKISILRSLISPKEARLNTVKFGFAGGIIALIGVLLTPIFVFLNYAPHYVLIITEIYGPLGYNALTFGGIVLGGIYGFIDGFILTALFAWVYNKQL